MADFPKPLPHGNSDSDETRMGAAAAAYAASPALQLCGELLTELRARTFSWWTPARLRERFPARDRMRWYEARPDLRQQITTQLTGLGAKAARKKDPDFQGDLIDSAIDDGDITVGDFEEAFEPRDLVVYGATGEIWRFFRESMPWSDSSGPHQELMAWLLKALVTDKSALDGATRRPILTPWELRTSIPGKAWHTHMPLEIRIAIDDARFKMEKAQPGSAFQVIHELSIATPKVVTGHIPLAELTGVLDAAERAFGLDASKLPAAARPDPAKSGPVAAKTSPSVPAVEAAKVTPRPATTPPPAANIKATPPSLKTPPPAPVGKNGVIVSEEIQTEWDEEADPFTEVETPAPKLQPAAKR
jgi:hypothetical protein